MDEADTDVLYADARAVTAAIRHHRSTAGFGFNTRVRVTGLTLPAGTWERDWPLVATDVMEGTNLESVDVVFGGPGPIDMTLTAVTPDA